MVSLDSPKKEEIEEMRQSFSIIDTRDQILESMAYQRTGPIAASELYSFAKGDKDSLKSLLTEKMQANFSSAIEDRNSKKIKSELTFVGMKSSAIEKFDKTAEAIFLTVKFVSEIISVKKDKDNKVVEGDPNKIKTVIDHWKFTKKISSKSPNWYLSEIKSS